MKHLVGPMSLILMILWGVLGYLIFIIPGRIAEWDREPNLEPDDFSAKSAALSDWLRGVDGFAGNWIVLPLMIILSGAVAYIRFGKKE